MMSIRWKRRTAKALMLAMSITSGWAQQEGGDRPQQPEEPEAPPIKWNSFSLGYSYWSISGNDHKLRQYASPTRDLDLLELRYTYPGNGITPYGRIVMKGIPKNDNVQEGQLIFANGRANLTFAFDSHEHYDPTPVTVDKSHERNAQATLSYSLTPDLGVWVAYRNKTRDISYEPPKANTAAINRTLAAGIEGNVLGGHAGVTVAERRFHDRNGILPTTINRRLDLFYGKQILPTLNLEGVFSNSRIQQRGFRDSNVRSWVLNSDWDIGPETLLSASFRREDLSLPNTDNAYVRKRYAYGARLSHRFLNSMFAQVGYEHREAERVRGDQTFVDVPKWDIVDGRVSGRLGSTGFRYALRGSWEHLNRAALMVTEDPRALYWDDRVRFLAKVTYGGERLNAYATYQYRFDQNTPRNVEISSQSLTIGGSYSFSDRTSAFLEFANESYRASGVRDEAGYDLDWFFPSSTSIGVGFNHVFDSATSLSIGLSHYVTNNDNPLGLRDGNIRNTELTATFKRQIDQNNAVELVVAPWTYRDRLSDQMGYRSTMIGINWTVKF